MRGGLPSAAWYNGRAAMNCADYERLFDAYLDGQLGGTLRLEFDAHRLRCRRCQQTLAMLEACGHLIATDRREPSVSADFTDNVMAAVAQRESQRARPRRIRATRVAIVVGAVLQAAAVLLLAILMQSRPAKPAPGGAPSAPPAVAAKPASGVDATLLEAKSSGDLREAIYGKIEQLLLARENLTTQGKRALAYLNLDVPDAVARATSDPGLLNPLTGWLDALLPGTTEPPDSEDANPSQFAL